MHPPLIAVTTHRRQAWRALFAQQADWPTPLIFDDDPNFASRAQAATILFGDTPQAAQWLPKLPHIQWFHTTYSGIDDLLPHRQKLSPKLVVTNTRDIAGPHIAEYVLGHILAQSRSIPTYLERQRQCHWQDDDYATLQEAHALILGTGAIGRVLAQRLSPWFAAVDGNNRSGRQYPEFRQVAAWPPALLPQYRVVINTLPATAATQDLLNATFFNALADDALFINVGRGITVVEQDLLSALDAAPQRHAVLDVFRTEPLPPEHPFWRHPQVSVTPHVAAQSQPEWVLPIFRDNVQRYLNQQPLRNVVDLDLGY